MVRVSVSATVPWQFEKALSGYAHFEDILDHIGCDIVYDPVMLVIWVFEITIRRIGTQRFAGFAFCFEHRTDLLTGVLGIEFIENIDERSKIAVLLICAVHAVVDGNKADICAGKSHLGVVAHLEVVSSQSAHVLYNDRTDFALVHKCNKTLPVRAVEVRTAVPIVYEKHRVAEAVIISELSKDSFLVKNGIAITLEFIVTGETAIQSCDFIRRNSGGLSI